MYQIVAGPYTRAFLDFQDASAYAVHLDLCGIPYEFWFNGNPLQ